MKNVFTEFSVLKLVSMTLTRDHMRECDKSKIKVFIALRKLEYT